MPINEKPAPELTCCTEPAQEAEFDLRPVEGPNADEELAGLAEITGELPLAQSTVSEHIRILKEAGLIRGRVDGPRVGYCIEAASLRRLKALVAVL
ncbi:MAG: ArsR family transcriptional regulator [Verrucomicrobia bacterium]|nr:ArsR family transcriptional regulator [Verrucomicrobiota bacterium]